MSDANDVSEFVRRKIIQLGMDNQWSKGMLARLRRSVGKDIRDSQESWELTLGDMPPGLSGRIYSNEFLPSPAENAAHIALTMFAMHMQGRSTTAHSDGTGFATAIRMMMNESNMEGIKRRFDSMVTATDLSEFSYHARGLIQLMRSSGDYRFDYAMFARDLYYYQFPDGKRNTLIRWGQEFYMKPFDESKEEE